MSTYSFLVKMVLDFEKPRELRKGQMLFNFLEWLAHQGYPTKQSVRMADPFHIPDDELDALWNNFLAQVNKMLVRGGKK